MRRINLARILFGALLAGMVLNAFEYFLHMQILAKPWSELSTTKSGTAGAQPSSQPMPSNAVAPAKGSMFAGFVISSFLIGACVVWIYAAIQPRFGPGQKAKVAAAVV